MNAYALEDKVPLVRTTDPNDEALSFILKVTRTSLSGRPCNGDDNIYAWKV